MDETAEIEAGKGLNPMGKDDFELIGGTKAGFCKERADDEEAVARQKKPPFPAATNGRALFINQSPSQ